MVSPDIWNKTGLKITHDEAFCSANEAFSAVTKQMKKLERQK